MESISKLMQTNKTNKKGAMGLQHLVTIAMTFVLAGVVVITGILVVQSLTDQLTNGSSAEGAGNATVTALATIPGWFGILITISVAAILIGVVVTSFVFGRR